MSNFPNRILLRTQGHSSFSNVQSRCLDDLSDVGGMTNFSHEPESFDQGLLLYADDQVYEFAQVPGICTFECLDVLHTMVALQDDWKEVGPDRHQARQRTSDATVAVLERMNLREPVVQPRG